MKNVLKAFGVIALVAIIGFSMAACGGGDDGSGENNNNNNPSGGGDKRAELVGKWVKDGGLNQESIDYDGTGKNSSELLYFRVGTAGVAQYYAYLASYDGTTVKVGSDKDPFSPIIFTATITGGKLTLSGLTTGSVTSSSNKGDSVNLSVFNGTYTKQ